MQSFLDLCSYLLRIIYIKFAHNYCSNYFLSISFIQHKLLPNKFLPKRIDREENKEHR